MNITLVNLYLEISKGEISCLWGILKFQTDRPEISLHATTQYYQTLNQISDHSFRQMQSTK